MKVRFCSKCGKHNLEDAFSCINCGSTLSMKALMDLDSGQLLNVKPIAGQTVLWEISSFFEQDVRETLKLIEVGHESIVWGCNLSELAQEVPLRATDPLIKLFSLGEKIVFRFGYLIITSKRLICVYFECKTDERGFSERACFSEPRWERYETLYNNSLDGYWVLPIPAVDSPKYPITDYEKNSRKVVAYELKELVSVRLFESTIDSLIRVLVLRFKSNNEVEFAFKIPDTALKADKLFSASIGK